MTRRALVAALLLGCLLLAGTAAAAPLALKVERYVIAGGGGAVSMGSYHLQGTVGQPMAGGTTYGDIDLCAGFWCARPLYRIYLPFVLRSTP